MQTATITPSPLPKPTYELVCHGCGWHQPAPTKYRIAQVLASIHQKKVVTVRPHIVEFVPVGNA